MQPSLALALHEQDWCREQTDGTPIVAATVLLKSVLILASEGGPLGEPAHELQHHALRSMGH